MKLIGSIMEREFREELEASHQQYFSANSKYRLKSFLTSKSIPWNNAYILNWIPEQTEDIYVILIEGKSLISVEIDRIDSNSPPLFEEIDIKEYMHGLSRMNQVKLLVAKELAGM